MTCDLPNGEGVPKYLKKLLALAVKDIHWSYAIYWSISAKHPGTLEWADGYYNGDIKTRKTNQTVELDADLLGLSRSEQLRELYEFLSDEKANPHAKRPLAALSPEDLSDTEWYYLVCMSFIFDIGQGLPGRTWESGKPIWLHDAGNADSKPFSRSLLAKSASIQTLVCFPFIDGVVELGMTELVSEDPSLIQNVRTFLEIGYPKSNRALNTGYILDKENIETNLTEAKGCQEQERVSPLDSFELDQQTENAYQVEGADRELSCVESLNFMDTELSNSGTLDDYLYPEKVVSVPEQYRDHTALTLMDIHCDDMHYHSILSTLLKTSHHLILGPQFRNVNHVSSFIPWEKRDLPKFQKSRIRTPQRLLKKILFEVPRVYGDHQHKCSEDIRQKEGCWNPKVDDGLAERKWRDELDKRILTLRSMLPLVRKEEDNISILDDTIAYLKKLQERVEEFESRSEFTKSEAKLKRKHQLEETTECTSNNCGNNKYGMMNKRKSSEMEPDINHVATNNSLADNVDVKTNDKDVLIDMRCAWKEGVLLEIMDALTDHHLDCHSVQSSMKDEFLHLTIKSKFKGSSIVSSRMIKHALRRIAGNF